MRKTFFRVLYDLTTSMYTSPTAAVPIKILSSLQIAYIILKSSTSELYEQQMGFSNILLSVTSATVGGSMSNSFSEHQFEWIGAIVIVYFVLFFSLIATIFIQIIRTNVCNRYVKRLAAVLSVFHAQVVFFPLQYLLFNIIHEFTECDLEINSWGCNTFWFTTAIILSIANIGLAIVKEFCLFEVCKTKDALSAQNNFESQIGLLHKFTGLLLYTLTRDSVLMPKINPFLHVFLLLWTSYVMYRTLPFYNFKVLKIVIIMTSFNLSLSVISIIKGFEENNRISEILLFTLSPLMMKMYLRLFEKLFQSIQKGNFNNSPQRAIHFAVTTKELFFEQFDFAVNSNKYSKTAIISYGSFAGKLVGSYELRNQGLDNIKREFYSYLLSNLVKLLEKCPRSEVLKLYIANIYLRKYKNFAKFEALVETISKSNPSFAVRISIERLNRLALNICMKATNDENNYLELFEYFKHRENDDIIKRTIHLEIDKHLKLWSQFKEHKVSVIDIIKMSSEIESLSSKIFKRYHDQVNLKSPQFTSFMLIYATYLNIIKELPYEAFNIIKSIRLQMENPNTGHILDLSADETAMIMVSLKKDKLGQVIDISPSAQTIFKTKKSRIIGCSVEQLLPSFVFCWLKLLISKYVKGNVSELDTGFNTYATTAEGMLFEVKMQFQLFPHRDHGLTFVLLLNKLSSPGSIIIMDSRGTIIECSKDLNKIVNSENMDSRSMKIEDIFPQLKESLEASHILETTKRNINNGDSVIGHDRNLDSYHKALISPGRSLDNSTESLRTPQKGYDHVFFAEGAKDSFTNRPSLRLKNLSNRKEYYEEQTLGTNSKRNREKDDTQDALWQTQSFIEGVRAKSPLNIKSPKVVYNIEIKPFCMHGENYRALILNSQDQESFLNRKNKKGNSSVLDNVELVEHEDCFADNFPVADEGFRNKCEQGKRLEENTQHIDHYIQPKPIRYVTFNTENIQKQPVQEKKKNSHLSQMMVFPNKADQTENQSISGVSRNRMVRAIKEIKQIFSKKRLHPLSKFSIFGIYFIMLLVGLLLSITYFLAQNSISQIHRGLDVVAIANDRLNLSIDIWSKLLIIYSRATDARPNPAGARIFQNIVYTNTLKLILRNRELIDIVSEIQDKQFVEQVFARDIWLWRALDKSAYEKIEADTFSVTDLLINKYLGIANFSTSNINRLANDTNFLLTLNDTANEYWLASERLILSTENLLDSIIARNISLLEVLYIVVNGSLFLLFCCFAGFVWVGIKAYKRLFISLNRVEDTYILQRISQLEETKEMLDEDSETREFVNRGLDFITNPRYSRQNRLPTKLNHEKESNQKFFIRSMILHLLRYLVLSLCCICVISGMFLKTILDTIDKFNSFERIKSQISFTTTSICQDNLFLGNFYFLILLTNNTNMPIRGTFARVQASQSINYLSKMNERLISVFSDEINDNEGVITTLFNKDICSFIPETRECPRSASQGITGLLSLNGKYYQSSVMHLDMFDKNPNFNSTKNILSLYATAVSSDLPTLINALRFLSSYLESNFDNKVDEFAKKQMRETLIILGIVAFSTIILQVVTIRKFKSFDIGRYQILNQVPFAFFENCRALKFYLVREFNEQVTEIKEFI